MDGPDIGSIAAAISPNTSQITGEVWLQLIVLFVALVLCGFASAAETALTSVSRIKLKNLIEEGDQQALEIEKLLAEPNTFLSTILVVNSVAVIVASSMATVLALQFSATWGELISSVLISVVVLIFCEITPKTAAVQNPLRWAKVLVGLVRGASWMLRPIVWLLGIITTSLVRLLGGQVKHKGPFVTEEELRLLVTVGEEEGVLEEEETEMIHSIFEFADTTVREVMVPRIDMITLSSDATVTEAVDLALQGGFSRIPVYEAEIGVDEIIGVLYTKDMLKQLREGHHSYPIRDLVRPAYFVPETKKLDDLLHEIRQNRVHIVIVVDEYGSVAGLVTIEDLVEEIVGDIKDEYDHEENLYEKINEHEYVFDAKINIYDFNDLMDTHLGDEDYDTLGGFVYAQLDKIPTAGDVVTSDDMTFAVLATRGRRITKIRVERASQEDEAASPLRLLPAPKDTDTPPEAQESTSPSSYQVRGTAS
ncbi:gliding motility protein GldE [Reticulibacter mediterranei]|uniref:Gliding motility protein GldE n=1 Tax=Reticulibacter mediterranei TaxID=2778369 RepID=A0A8J3MYX2_9CHLR|nr:hemolysin family protein [Reticulibacter mediterranei]GHO91297.1 gliding motility protein GldE [Reticulibacter mediterranei]